MAEIGLDEIFYAMITEDNEKYESYGIPKRLAHGISVNLSVEIAEGKLHADNRVIESVREFKGGTMTLNTDDLSNEVLSDLTGAEKDENGVFISSGEDISRYVGIAFRTKKADGRYRYFWVYKVQFGTPSTEGETKGDGINFKTPTITGTIMQRNKPGINDKHPWKADVIENKDNKGITGNWFKKVYEPGAQETEEPILPETEPVEE